MNILSPEAVEEILQGIDVEELLEPPKEPGPRERAAERAVELKEALLTTLVNKLQDFEQEILLQQERRTTEILAEQTENWYIACQVVNGNFDHLNFVKYEDETDAEYHERVHMEMNMEMDRVQAFINEYKSYRM